MIEENDYLKGANDLKELAQGVIVGVPILQRKRLQRIAALELIAEAITLEANKEYIYGILDAALMLKLITKKEWLNALKDKAE